MRAPAKVVMIALFGAALAMTACSSDDEGTGGSTDGGGAPAGASDGSALADGKAQELKQAFDMSIEVTSPVFNDIRRIPKKHTCGGKLPDKGVFFEQGYNPSKTYANTSPPLEWTGVPEGTVSIALVMDSDQAIALAPGQTWSQWVIWNIPADATGLPEAVATTTEVLAIGPTTRQGFNDDKTVGYSGPCPLAVKIPYGPGFKPKVLFDYVFHVYALDTELDLGPETTMEDLLEAMEGHVLGAGEIKGQFSARTKKLEF